MARIATPAPAPVELRIKEIGQLFHTLDPLPFRERDLDATVEEYVVGWARELPASRPISLVVHLPRAEAQRAEARQIGEAIRNYFGYRAEVTGGELKELFRRGRVSLLIGLAVLATCVVVGNVAASRFGAGYVGRFFNEGLIILGWVANWRPIEIFLYDWWPLVRRCRLYTRLSQASVDLRPVAGS